MKQRYVLSNISRAFILIDIFVYTTLISLLSFWLGYVCILTIKERSNVMTKLQQIVRESLARDLLNRDVEGSSFHASLQNLPPGPVHQLVMKGTQHILPRKVVWQERKGRLLRHEETYDFSAQQWRHKGTSVVLELLKKGAVNEPKDPAF